MGSYLVAGWTFDDVLEMHWDQIALGAEVLALHRVGMIEMIVGPLTGKTKSPQVSGRQTKAEKKDQDLMRDIAAAGLRVNTKKAP